MAAPIKLVGGMSRDQPDHHERRQGTRPGPRLMVTVGKSDTLRPIPLTEDQVFQLVGDGVKLLDQMRKERKPG